MIELLHSKNYIWAAQNKQMGCMQPVARQFGMSDLDQGSV